VCLLLVPVRFQLLDVLVTGLLLLRRLLSSERALLRVAVLRSPILGCWVLVLESRLLQLLVLELVLVLELLLLSSSLVLE